jgi:hypothetical protein
MSGERKVISIGDYIKVTDRVVDIELIDPINPSNKVVVSLRIKRANPKETIKIMEFVNRKMGDKSVFTDKEIADMDAEERVTAINLAYNYDATLISSCVFLPPANGDLSQETEKVFPTADDVLDKCPLDLFDRLKEIVGQQRMVVPEGEAKK